MARTLKIPGKGINFGGRVPLSRFCEPITILRMESAPSQDDESWVKQGIRLGDFNAAFEEGEVKLVQGEKQSQKEFFLFLLHADDAMAFEPTDYVIHGTDVYRIVSFQPLGGKRGYHQLNTLPWGKLRSGDFVLNADAEVMAPPSEPPTTDNLFWGALPPVEG